jgi:hypothetical protein
MLAAPESRDKFQPAAAPTALSSARSAKATTIGNHFFLCGPVAPGASAARVGAAGVPRAAVVTSSADETTGNRPSRTRLRSLISWFALV